MTLSPGADRDRLRTSPGRPGSASPTTPPRTRWPTRCSARCPAACSTPSPLDVDLAGHGDELRHAAPDRRLQLAELGPGGRPAGPRAPRSVTLSRRTIPSTPDPTRQRPGAADIPERLPELDRLGHRHQPAGALPRVVEDPARGREWGTRPAGRSRSGTGTPTAASSSQGKRFRFGATASPTLFAFFPGHRPARAGSATASRRSSPGTTSRPPTCPRSSRGPSPSRARRSQLRSDAQQRVSVGLSQVFEGKFAAARRRHDARPTRRKIRILSINTSGVTYDFEQAKKPGFTGWATQTLTNSVLSDLLPGLQPELHPRPLARGGRRRHRQVRPFLQNVSASFALSGNTFRAIGSIFGLGGKSPRTSATAPPSEVPTSYVAESGRRTRPGSFFSSTQAPFRPAGPELLGELQLPAHRGPVRRRRPSPTTSRDRQSLGFSTNFSPTPFWSLSWSSQYNITDGQVRVAGRPARARAARVAGGLQLRPESQRELRVLLLDLPDRPARAEVRLRPDDHRPVDPGSAGHCPRNGTAGVLSRR